MAAATLEAGSVQIAEECAKLGRAGILTGGELREARGGGARRQAGSAPAAWRVAPLGSRADPGDLWLHLGAWSGGSGFTFAPEGINAGVRSRTRGRAL